MKSNLSLSLYIYTFCLTASMALQPCACAVHLIKLEIIIGNLSLFLFVQLSLLDITLHVKEKASCEKSHYHLEYKNTY